ncbi:jupiter microtubule associated homolog 1 [Pelobates fuscus]|uniref:jupiter microtubule associated homolog 1 n=1 Tax=Pelobates fuscus TaxID=191477 RepID=UPI002FE4601A
MTTTSTFSGLDPEGRSSSRILRPPGGGSSFTFGVGDQPSQPTRRHKMASNIFGISDYNSLSEPCVQETGAPAIAAAQGDSEDTNTEWTCPSVECDSADVVEQEAPEIIDGNEEPKSIGVSAESVASVTIPTRRNPPGGKSSLILG